MRAWILLLLVAGTAGAAPNTPPVDPAHLPPYLGIFGPRELLPPAGLRSKPGTWMEYALGSHGRMRIQEVKGAPAGHRWLELLTRDKGAETSALKLLVREPAGTLARLLARMPGFPVLELPLESMTATSPPTPGWPPFATGTPRQTGRETVQVPLGRFNCERWEVRGRDGLYRFWIARDVRVPFNGAIQMDSPAGPARAVATGSDAQPRLTDDPSMKR